MDFHLVPQGMAHVIIYQNYFIRGKYKFDLFYGPPKNCVNFPSKYSKSMQMKILMIVIPGSKTIRNSCSRVYSSGSVYQNDFITAEYKFDSVHIATHELGIYTI